MAHTRGPQVSQKVSPLASAVLNPGALRDVVLVRVVCAGAEGLTRAGLRRDLTPLVEHRLSPGECRRQTDDILVALHGQGLVAPKRLRIVATSAGVEAAHRFLGAKIPDRADWVEVRDVFLVARALGGQPEKSPRRLKLASALGLRRAIIERSLGVSAGKAQSAAALRDAVAGQVARQKTGGDKASRRRAVEQLLRRPRTFDNDGALVAELAAEQVGAVQTSAPSLRLALLRRLLGRGEGLPPAAKSRARGLGAASKRPANAATTPGSNGHAPAVPAPRPQPARPDIAEFSREVRLAATGCAQGWPGNRRAFISHVWAVLLSQHPNWALTEIDYKNWLTQAHRAGHLTLAYADLRDKNNIRDVQASAVHYGNSEWHFIRVE